MSAEIPVPPQVPEVAGPPLPEESVDEPAAQPLQASQAHVPSEATVPDAGGDASSSSEAPAPPNEGTSAEAKRRGRPTGAKNKPKIERVPVKQVVVEDVPPKGPPPSPVEAARPPTPAPQLNLTDMLRETLRKMQAERQQQQSNLYANRARSGSRSRNHADVAPAIRKDSGVPAVR